MAKLPFQKDSKTDVLRYSVIHFYEDIPVHFQRASAPLSDAAKYFEQRLH